MKYWIIASALLLGACATTADNGEARARAAEQGTVTGVNENGERTRCEYIRETGTRFRTRVCHTEREWERIEENAQQVAQDSQNRTAPDQGPTVSGF
tara:strand:- start:1334 stop:1624 length:291 start_codon:yes stop_codon:yes gene_type:complete